MGRKIMLFFVIVGIVASGVAGAYWVATLQLQKTFHEAQDVLAKGNVQMATELFERVYRKRPDSPEGYQALYSLCQLTFSLPHARDFAARALDDVDKARSKFFLGNALFLEGNKAQAMAELAEIATKYPAADVADDALFLMAKSQIEEGKLLEARALLRTILERYPDSSLTGEVYAQYGKVNISLLFSPVPTPASIQYTVASGDTVETIARKFGTTADIVRAANGLTNDRIRKGNLLKVDKGKYSIVVSKSRNTLTLQCDGELFKVYSVGTGKSNSTPVGDYKITTKLVNPPWYKPGGGLVPFGDKGNLLGTRWMGINLTGYGIHGTWEPDTVGKQSSAGCVRLLNEEVEELYKIVNPGTPVKIVD